MSQFLGSAFRKSLIEQLGKSTRSITIISPYVTMPAVRELIKRLPSTVIKRSLITVPPGVEYVNGSVDVAALEQLNQHGFEIHWLPNLHAKIYLLDEKIAFVGSANFTTNGWELDQKGNVEDMIMFETSKSDRDHINTRYITTSTLLDLNGKWKKDVIAQKQKFQELNYQLMKSVQIDFPNNNGANELAVFSDYKLPPNGYQFYFKFTIAKVTWQKIKKDKSAIRLKLGGEKQSPDATITIPFSNFGKYLTSLYTTDKRQDWQFGLYVDNEQNLTLRIRDKVISINRKDLIGTLRVDITVTKKRRANG
ncbi:phospholipase D family protein [Paenibacillus sp. KQZ6P-2]|uniref:Phospholipase D family protein n=1 Tax=Paenibacillus mangrovi TaxID=2931978 RepID=A0A9X2B389_9BACL|nr:phospholipase D family protein [Paenibacillus mangrovi]MCJ8013394.1 phospholipase D family protein [Paenibacillus mangrovi]